MRSHKDIQKLQPYLHLPVQSGSDRVLKEMNRGYTFSDYMKIIDRTREYRPDIAVSGDFIVGFPGETDKDFQDTLRIVEEVKYAHAYSFKYSSRPGTPASIMENHIEEDVKSERLKILQDLIKQQTRDFNKSFEGKEIENENKKGYIHGFSSNYVRVKTPWRKDLVDCIKPYKLKKIDLDGLVIVEK